MSFVKNCWYMAAWAGEIGNGPLVRRLLDMPVVLFRTESGKAVALVDRCPHRFAPLSRGKVVGENIQCGYHGLCFDTAGQCSDSPFGLPIPPRTEVHSFPVVERDDIIWFWPGEPTLADPSTIPDFGYHVDPAFRVVRGASHIKAHYELVTDNLMDLTHTRYLHPVFGGDNWVPEVSFSQDGETVYSHYDLPSYPPSEFSEEFMPTNGRMVKEKDYIRWNAPSTMYLHIEFGIVGAPEAPVVLNPSSHILAPETASTTHYFWASAAPVDAPITDEDHYEAVKYAFDAEDAPMLEAIQERMEGWDFWDRKPAILAYDSGGIRARRIMRQKLKSEQQEPATDELRVASA